MMYAEIITVTENSAVLAFSAGYAGHAVWEIAGGPSVRSAEAAGLGRLAASDLAPGTEYASVLRTEKGESCSLKFRTLPQPEGQETDRIFLTADWHLSHQAENRKGRCFAESESLAWETLRDAEKLHPDAILNAGDLTNKADPAEYETAASLVKGCRTPFHSVPGNHDHPERGLWQTHMGKRRFRLDLPGGTVLGIDTADALLHPDDAAEIESELDSAGRVTILSHYQLFPSEHIDHKPRLHIRNAADYPGLFEKMTALPTVVWCGHQNICAVTRAGKMLQVNLPQIPQWPCGSLLVRRFPNGTFYTFRPIRSEALRQWCRTAGNEAALYYGERQWQSDYRCRDHTRTNFFIPEASDEQH